MRSLVGRAVVSYLAEEKPPLRLEGRIDDSRDDMLEVRLARRELSSLKEVLRRTLKVTVEYVEGRDVYGVPCRLETYGVAFPPVLVLRPTGPARLIHRRRHERYVTSLPVRLISVPRTTGVKGGPAEEWEDGRLINLSAGGAAVSLPREVADGFPPAFTPGSELTLQFVAREMVKPRARVVRREEAPEALLLGVEFLPLASHDATSLNAYLNQLTPDAKRGR